MIKFICYKHVCCLGLSGDNSLPTSTSEDRRMKISAVRTKPFSILFPEVSDECSRHNTAMSGAPRSPLGPSSSNAPMRPLPRSHRRAYRTSGMPCLYISVCQQPSVHRFYQKKVRHRQEGRRNPGENMKTYRQSHEE